MPLTTEVKSHSIENSQSNEIKLIVSNMKEKNESKNWQREDHEEEDNQIYPKN